MFDSVNEISINTMSNTNRLAITAWGALSLLFFIIVFIIIKSGFIAIGITFLVLYFGVYAVYTCNVQKKLFSHIKKKHNKYWQKYYVKTAGLDKITILPVYTPMARWIVFSPEKLPQDKRTQELARLMSMLFYGKFLALIILLVLLGYV